MGGGPESGRRAGERERAGERQSRRRAGERMRAGERSSRREERGAAVTSAVPEFWTRRVKRDARLVIRAVCFGVGETFELSAHLGVVHSVEALAQ